MLKSFSGSQSNVSDAVDEEEEAVVVFEAVSMSFSEGSVPLGRFQLSCSCSATNISSFGSSSLSSSPSLVAATVLFAAVVVKVLANKRLIRTPGTVLAVKENNCPVDDDDDDDPTVRACKRARRRGPTQ